MGSINKDPKKLTPTAVTPTVITPIATVTTPEKTESEIAAESRTESLLRRSRGRFGTILSGFTGFLNPTRDSNTQTRKTLLGE